MKYLSALLAVLFLAGFAFATPGYEVKVISQTENEIRFEINVTQYKIEKVQIEGKVYLVVSIPEAGVYMKQGYPEIPQIAKLVKISDIYEPELEVISQVEDTVLMEAPILPSKGHFTRDIDPATVPYECGDVYKKDVFWPCKEHQLTIGEAFIFRDVRGVRVEYLPISANHVQMQMKITKKIEFIIKLNKISRTNVITRTRGETIDTSFANIYESAFVNYESSRAEVPKPNRKVVAVVPSIFETSAAINAWITHKTDLKWEVTKITQSSLGAFDADTIKAKLQELYNNEATKFTYVVLFGDANNKSKTATPTPTFLGKKESAAADRVYVRLAGNDNVPDAFISRITGTTEDHIAAQVNKIIAYENKTAQPYHKCALLIASDQGSPTDYARADWLKTGGHVGQKYTIPAGEGLAGQGYSTCSTQYDPTASVSGVATAVNNGVGVIGYIGHGSVTSWGTTGFSNSNVASLTNKDKYPVIWSVACVNGQFWSTCFAEAWLLKVDGGAVAMEAASTNESWVPPCDKQAATLHAMIKKDGDKTFGYLESVGCIAGLTLHGETDSSEGNKMAEQCHLFGDCTMIVKNAK